MSYIYFDWKYYSSNYPDILRRFNTPELGIRHWIRFGMKEGNICNKIFEKIDINEYAKSNKLNINKLNDVYLHYYNKNKILNTNVYIKDKEDTIFNGNKKIVAVIPVCGRELLLKYTIRRLYKKNNLYKVICVGETDEEKKVVLEENGIWVNFKNEPLGEKWNRGFKVAELYEPDAILFVGSSDWISSDWIDDAYQYINNYGIIGKREYTMADITNKELKYCNWLGYPEDSERYNETIGIGRLLSKHFLKSINYLPFDNKLNSGMDWSMYCKCIKNNYKVKILENNSIFLSVSCDLWINKHQFIHHYLACTDKNKFLELNLSNNFNNIYLRTNILKENEIAYINNEFPELEEFKKDYINKCLFG